jgi:DNA transformation protein
MDASFKDFVLDQLDGMRPVEARRMFGGHGLYCGKVFFGIIFKGRLYFKTSQDTRPEYLKQGMGPFSPNPKQTLKNYYEVPVDVVEDQDILKAWALKAVALQ